MTEETTAEISDEERLEAMVRTGRFLAAQIKELTEQKTIVEDKIKAMTPIGWSLVVDGVPASKRKPNRAFSKLLALAAMTPEQRQECKVTEPRFDDKLIRKKADELGLTESCMEESDDPSKAILKLLP